MNKDKIEKQYVSSLDRFLQHFDQEHPNLSPSQKKEVAKYQKIGRLRDFPQPLNASDSLPEDF